MAVALWQLLTRRRLAPVKYVARCATQSVVQQGWEPAFRFEGVSTTIWDHSSLAREMVYYWETAPARVLCQMGAAELELWAQHFVVAARLSKELCKPAWLQAGSCRVPLRQPMMYYHSWESYSAWTRGSRLPPPVGCVPDE
jgi:hypothetical protein